MPLPLPSRQTCGILIVTLAGSQLASGCHAQSERPDPAVITSRVKALAQKAKADLVEVQGGEFLMGDFGEIHSDDKLPYTSETDNKPLHKVRLSNYAIQKYKVTYGDFDTYALAKGLPLPYTEPDTSPLEKETRRHPKNASFPIGVNWYDAQAYCQWLGQQIGGSMDLPTEAQWEYAARARGKFLIFATDNGLFENGRNVPTTEEVKKLSGHWTSPISVGLYPPNPLGLYDMGKNGYEWVKDWYADDYYSHSPIQNPQGPESGIKKVSRSHENGTDYPAMTMERHKFLPAKHTEEASNTMEPFSFRCAASTKNK